MLGARSEILCMGVTRGLQARAMSSEQFTFAYKPRLMGPVYEYALSPDSLDWATATGSGRIGYPMIKRIRLGYKPTNMANARFMAEIWPQNAAKLTIHSVSANSLVDVSNLGGEYVRFIRELHRRLESTNSNCVYEAGFPAWRWWPSAIFAVLTLFAVLYVIVQGLLSGQFLITAVITGVGIWFMWQIWNIVARNRPRTYRPNEIPADVLPTISE